jgi:hypothetical protein
MYDSPCLGGFLQVVCVKTKQGKPQDRTFRFSQQTVILPAPRSSFSYLNSATPFMEIELYPYTVNKRFALTISRGTSSQNQNLAVGITADNITGWGEAVPFTIGSQVQSFDLITNALQAFIPHLSVYHPLQRQSIEAVMKTSAPISSNGGDRSGTI